MLFHGVIVKTFKLRNSKSSRRTEAGEILNHAVAQHFNLPGHSVADMVVIGIERVIPTGDRKVIEAREHHWINQYRSVQYGNNTRH